MSTCDGPMRVLTICPELPTAACPGSMAPTARQIRSLRDLGIDVDVVDMRGVPKLKYLQVIPRLRRLAKKADLIHAHFGYCGWLARVAPQKPIVMSFMGDDLLGTPKSNGQLEWLSCAMVRWNKRLARNVDAVIVKSREMADVIAPVTATVIPNGVDLNIFQPRAREVSRRRLQFTERGRKVLFPGNPDNPGKGFDLASASVRVAASLMGESIDLVPLWNVAPDDVPVYMNACEAMLMTSFTEGSPNVVKEAMACDLPVIGVPVGDVHELLDGAAGYAKCERDADEIGRALAGILTHPTTVEGRKAILEKQLDLESVARRVIAVYERVLGVDVVVSPRPAGPDPISLMRV